MLNVAESSRPHTPKAIKLTWHPVGFPTNRAGCKPIQASREQSPCRCEAIGHCQAAAGHSGSQMDFATVCMCAPGPWAILSHVALCQHRFGHRQFGAGIQAQLRVPAAPGRPGKFPALPLGSVPFYFTMYTAPVCVALQGDAWVPRLGFRRRYDANFLLS